MKIFEKIVPRDKKIDISNLETNEKEKYELRDTLINNSLHIGFKDKSNYRKGLDCLIDAKILDRCDVYYKSKVILAFLYENLEIHDLNDTNVNKMRKKIGANSGFTENNEVNDVEQTEEQVELTK